MNSELTEKTDIREASRSAATFESAKDSGRNGINASVPPHSKRGRVRGRQGIRRFESFRGWILYNGACGACTSSAKRFEQLFRRRGFHFLPLQTEWVTQRLRLGPGALLKEMHVLTRDDRDLAGVDAVIFLARQVWWAWPVIAFAKLPGMYELLDRGYRWIATHRGCDHVACEVDKQRLSSRRLNLGSSQRQRLLEAWPAWMALLILPVDALLLRNHVAPWQFMWLMAGAIFFGCKWLTAWRAQKPNSHLKLAPTLGYFFAWPGMDAEKFLTRPRQNSTALSRQVFDWEKSRDKRKLVVPMAKAFLGGVLLFGAAPFAQQPLIAGWIGMIGMILILHFGLFQLLAIGWRKAGIDTEPIMNAPLRSKTVSEFWGRRWNSAFNRLAFEFVSRPIMRRLGGRSSCDTARRSRGSSTLYFGAGIATLTAFLVSGLIHELVISLPAGAGYGLPTAYFLLQGVGILLEPAFPQIRSRIFTISITGVPAFWLFHPPFVHNVILPFIKEIGAL